MTETKIWCVTIKNWIHWCATFRVPHKNKTYLTAKATAKFLEA